jgi:trimethylamine:corrinoid methyltransferase-like protein
MAVATSAAPTYDILGEENLIRIEQAADRILAETASIFATTRSAGPVARAGAEGRRAARAL